MTDFTKPTFSNGTACAEWRKPTFSNYNGGCAQVTMTQAAD